MTSRRTHWLLLCVAILLSVSLRLPAQSTASGGLTGLVTDPSHALVEGARVEIRETAKGAVYSTQSDRQGAFHFFFLAPGRYVVAILRNGFEKQSLTVNVPLGPPVSVNVTLAIQKAMTAVNVIGEAPLLHTDNGDFSSTKDEQQISEVPNPGNDLTYIAQTTPGAVMDTDMPGGANFSLLGMPGTSNRYTVNGMTDNDGSVNLSMIGALFLLLGQNSVEEATVVSIGYSGQFGGTAGANINYLTKSGTNGFHGNAQYYWNGRVLNSNDWINNAYQVPRPFDIAHQWAGSIGGPILRDKLFFFLDSEGVRVQTPVTQNVTIPSKEFEAATIANIDARFGAGSASDAFYRRIFGVYDSSPGASKSLQGNFGNPLGCPADFSLLGVNTPCARHFLTARESAAHDALTEGRVDWNVSASDRLFVQLQNDRGFYPFYLDALNPLFDAGGDYPTWQGQALETHTFGAHAANQLLLAFNYVYPNFFLIHGAQAVNAFPATLNGDGSGTFSGFAGATNFLGSPSHTTSAIYQFSDDVLKTQGSHKLGFGINLERVHTTTTYSPNALGTITPQTLDAFYQGGVDPISPNVDFTVLNKSFDQRSAEHLIFGNLALYAQDEWHARSNLSLTVALRAEHQANPLCEPGCIVRLDGDFSAVSHDPAQPYNHSVLVNQEQAFAHADRILWSPRVSFAWQPLGAQHNAVLRGGVGIFYDPVPGSLAFSLSGNPPLLNSYVVLGDNLSPNEKTNLFQDAFNSNTSFVNGFKSGQTLAQIQAANPSFFPPALITPEKQPHSAQYQRWNLEWEQAFGTKTSLSVGYTGHHGIHQLVLNPSANAFGFGSLPASQCTSPPVLPCADPRFSELTQITTNAVSNYHGMLVSFRHRFSRWTKGQFQANYTYSHAFDEVSNGGLFPFTFGSSINPQDPSNLRAAYGPAEYDVRHSLNASYVWEIPVKVALGGHGRDAFVKGWELSGTIFARTGFPYSVFDYAQSGNLAQNNYFSLLYSVPARPVGPQASCGKGAAIPVAAKPCFPPQVLADGSPNPNALFVQSGCETGFYSGTLPGASGPCGGPAVNFTQGRNRFRGPSYFSTDLSITKLTKLPEWEKGTLGIGFQFFNLFNHPNFGFSDNNTASATFGQIPYMEQPATTILGAHGTDASARMIQVKVQLQF
jgi:hypothetical protein